ncbi:MULTISPECIES: PaaX family transcriptional regulator C-terminal domain-containing protein [Streptomyces]|uniref:PaaX family transcriptional regulator C-terminal domain-containing protein n=1 Tax=Streptomyces glycanivorans TaxID=3033808 RepID=A0ABY9JLD1_9ACTN|nr:MULTISPECIES: PaaX family transcriptional regulator C-terminal domain-containing protein [unclassified Streptomyces]WSQ81882.1 PaaX family transcriptional regulator [Streptomyces sp. NBC_01213]TXS12028.1 PaaX family transcriptional regulator [Streptomyces sp. wa22]WLQ68526.1 PaaX family transcriptional regulator C-terminal domain-containing protein [Streptomyces sp. Alt3]WSQ89209.1 PaaX family transcriptional regulator [Streptomyces sp. NBC_01212]WSR04785.1 PaaX family transcriptional regul
MTAATRSDTPGAANRETRHGPLITTLFGLYARGEANWLSVASLVRVMSDLGVEAPAVRSAVSRMKRRGILESVRHGSKAGYSLADSALGTLAEGDVRIFERARATVEDGWLLVVFSVPETEREKRHELRTCLTRLGFGTAAPGAWIAPGNLATETRRTLESRRLTGYVDIFGAEHLAFGDLRSKVSTWWDLDELTDMYADFLHRHSPLADASSWARATPREAFRAYVPMLTEWRRLPYRDPGIPLALLPADWKGSTAGALFDELDGILSERAREHALTVIHGAAR